LGNVLCVVSWLFGYVLVARASPLRMVVLELIDSLFFVGIAALLIPLNAGVGFTQAYAAAMAFAAAVHIAWVILMLRRMPQHLDHSPS
jgi:hypothetical protein